MNLSIKKYDKKYKKDVKNLMKKFYKTDGVLHDINENYIDNTMTLLDSNSELIEVILVLNSDKVVGYSLLSNTYSSECGGLAVWIDEIYVLDEYRGKKLSNKIFDYIIENYKNASRFRLEAVENNEIAISLFKKYGFEKFDYMQFIRQ